MNKRFVALVAVGIFATGHAATTQPAAVNDFAPLAYFEQSCARCHGDYGANYGDQFGKNLSDAKLAKAVDDMCSGPGNAPLSGENLQREIAFHRAMVDGKPFICITGNDGKQLSGENSDGATVTVDGKPAKVDGTSWTINVSTHPSPTIVATIGSRQTTITAPATFSHNQPTTAPAGK